MTNNQAILYWESRHQKAAPYSDEHWDAEERRQHNDYVDAMECAIVALKKQIPTRVIRENWTISKCPCCGCELGDVCIMLEQLVYFCKENHGGSKYLDEVITEKLTRQLKRMEEE